MNDIISFVDLSSENIKLGGFGKLKENLKIERTIFEDVEKARKHKVPIPKGFLLVGIPGCGKSLAAKITAKELNVKLYKIEFGNIMSKYVGDSEENLNEALKFAEENSPCVLWIDEFEKSIISSSDGGADGNISNRLLGIFLNWLQERKAPVYVVATVNKIDKMPPELLRHGRFDDIYEVDLPEPYARREIMGIKLAEFGIKYGENYSLKENEIKEFCNKLRGYSGADIETLVKEVKKVAYHEKRLDSITITDFYNAKGNIKSVETIMHDQILQIRQIFEKYNFKPVE